MLCFPTVFYLEMSTVFVIVKNIPARTDEFRYPDDGKPLGLFVKVCGNYEQAKSWVHNQAKPEWATYKILERVVTLA